MTQESRLDIFRLLVEKGSECMVRGAIRETLDLPHAAFSFHLDKLRQAGLITNKREGRSVYLQRELRCAGAVQDQFTEF
ncbi:MAG: helix-turn-helix transcriptional regulator [Caedimonas sp.]|nr:helix-turn-helix transcriptional regulator [Caedimonas sp.]